MMEQKPTMLSYIYQEEETMLSILQNYPSRELDELVGRIDHNCEEWLVLATGSSINAARSAKYYLERMAKVRIDIQEPFNYCHYETINPGLDLVIGISQSGQSTSTIEAMERVRTAAGIPLLAVTSIIDSEITKVTELILDIGCNRERVGYVTMGFTATVLSLMLFGLRLGVKQGYITSQQEQQEISLLVSETQKISTIISKTQLFFEQHQQDFKDAQRFSAIGYGPAVGTVKEMETKFSETVRVPSLGYELEAFMHGPYLEVNPQHRIFFLETDSPVRQKALLLKEYEARHTSHVFTVTTDEFSKDDKCLALDLLLDEWKAPYLLMIPFQLLAWNIAKVKGIDLTKRIYTDFSQAVKSKTAVQDYV